MASSLNKRKYADEKAEDSTTTSKKRWSFGDDDGDSSSSSLEVEVSSEKDPPFGEPAPTMVTPPT
jgi:hypothetical protein